MLKPHLIKNIQVLLNTLGIVSYIEESSSYNLVIIPSSYFNFSKYIGFSNKYRQERLNNRLSTLCKLNRISTLTKLSNLNKDCNNKDNNSYYYSKVKSVIELNKECLYDIEVDRDNTFWCNGLVSHNSQGLTLDRVQLNLKGVGTSFLSKQSGMLYTALSRVRTPEGLSIVGTVDDLMRSVYVNKDTLYE